MLQPLPFPAFSNWGKFGSALSKVASLADMPKEDLEVKSTDWSNKTTAARDCANWRRTVDQWQERSLSKDWTSKPPSLHVCVIITL